MSQSKKGLSNWLLVVAVLALAVAPLIFVRGGEFAGSDDKAKKAITEIQPGYKPWFKSLFEPASGESSVMQLDYIKDVPNNKNVKNEPATRYFSLY
jgi:cobalt transport protein